MSDKPHRLELLWPICVGGWGSRVPDTLCIDSWKAVTTRSIGNNFSFSGKPIIGAWETAALCWAAWGAPQRNRKFFGRQGFKKKAQSHDTDVINHDRWPLSQGTEGLGNHPHICLWGHINLHLSFLNTFTHYSRDIYWILIMSLVKVFITILCVMKARNIQWPGWNAETIIPVFTNVWLRTPVCALYLFFKESHEYNLNQLQQNLGYELCLFAENVTIFQLLQGIFKSPQN